MKLNKILIKSSSTKCGQLLTEAIKDNDLRALQRDMNRTILLLVMLFLMLGVVEQLKAVDSKNSFENTYNAPKILQFEGEQSYTADEIRKCLSNSAEYWTVAYRNLSKEHYTASVRRLIRAGYLHGGFADVEVSVLENKYNSFLVRIKEGQRYTCGNIMIEPVESFSSYNDLRKIIISPPTEDDSPYINVEWIKGEPAPMDEALNPINFSKNINRFLADSGRNLKCAVTITRQKEHSVADMHVSLIKYDPTHTVSEIIIDGSKKNSREEILDYLQIKQGMNCDDGLVARLDNKLLESARFLSHKIWIEDVTEKSARRKLHVQLRDYDKAPPLTQKLSRAEAGIVHFLEHLQNKNQWDKDLVLQISTKGMRREEIDVLRAYLAPLISPDIETIEAKIIFSNDGFFISFREGNRSGKDNLIAAISYSKSTGFGLCFPRLKIRYQSKKPIILNSPGRFNITASFTPGSEPDENGRNFQFALGVGAAITTAQNEDPLKDIIDINIAPVASINLLKGEATRSQITDQYLTIKNSNKNFDTTATIDIRENILVSLNMRDATTSNNLLSGSMQSGALGKSIKKIITETNSLSNNYDPSNEFGSFLATIVEISSIFISSEKIDGNIEKQTEILSRLAAKSGLFIENLLELDKADRFDLGNLDWSKVTRVGDREIPVRDMGQKNLEKIIGRLNSAGSSHVNSSNPFYEIISIFLFQFKDDLFSVGSWPWVMCIKSMTIHERDLIYSEEFLIDLCKSPNIGPIGCAVATYILANSGSEKAMDSALKGLGKIKADQFKNDYLPVLASDSFFNEFFTEVVQFYVELEPEEKKLLLNIVETMPSATETIQQLDQYPGKPILEILEPSLSSLWERALKNVIKDYLYSVVFGKTGA
tara:strand:+ start:477 stop:3119 length:2643 start_codon:yes stop_codon:yes gene_type:complete